MEAKYEARKQELLDECMVAPQIFDRVMPRLERFMDPFVENLVRTEQCEHASTFIQGLLSDLGHKNVESIAYRFGQERIPTTTHDKQLPEKNMLLRNPDRQA